MSFKTWLLGYPTYSPSQEQTELLQLQDDVRKAVPGTLLEKSSEDIIFAITRIESPEGKVIGATEIRQIWRRRLAAWHRLTADKAGNASIWEARIRTAEDLERQADQMERVFRTEPRPVEQ